MIDKTGASGMKAVEPCRMAISQMCKESPTMHLRYDDDIEEREHGQQKIAGNLFCMWQD